MSSPYLSTCAVPELTQMPRALDAFIAAALSGLAEGLDLDLAVQVEDA